MRHPETVFSSRLAAPLLSLLLAASLVACGGGGGEPASPTPPPAAGDPGALALAGPGELTAFVQGRMRTLQAQGRLVGGARLETFTGAGPTAVAVSADAVASAQAAAPLANAATPRSGTLLQEQGVDEADLLLTEGSHLYALQPQFGAGPRLQVHRRGDDGRAAPLKALTLPSDGAADMRPEGMVFSGDGRALAVLTQQWTPLPADEVCREVCITILPYWMHGSVGVQRVDIADPAAAAAGERLAIDGQLVDSRRIGDTLYVVTTHRPVLAAEALPASASAADREAAIARTTAAELLPRLRRNGGAPQPLLAETECWLQGANASLAVEFTTITAIDLRSPTLAQTSRCIVGGSEALYMTPASLYLATTRWNYGVGDNTDALVFPTGMRTDIHKFALAAGAIAYRGSGSVEGHLGWDAQRKSLRLSEQAGDLRVLSFTGEQGWATSGDATGASGKPPSPARLTVLREAAGGALQLVATLPNAARPAAIGKPGEQVHGVRFVGERGYVVTFRRTDPLYVLDLSDPADPRSVGELEITGFSETLVPLAGDLLLGIGRDADANGVAGGLKFALFDVSQPAQPQERASLVLGGAGSSSALDHSRHGLNLLELEGLARLALPVLLTGPTPFGWQHGLQRFEVDTAAGTLRALPLLAGEPALGPPSLWLERSVQIGDWVYHLSQGTLLSHRW